MRTQRRLVTAAATTCLALGLGACGISDDGPHPGLAAEVDGHSISVDQLGDLLNAVCVSTTEDPNGSGTSRGDAESQLLKSWVSYQIVMAYAADKDLEVKVADLKLETIPGWAKLDEDEQKAVTAYVDLQARAQKVMEGFADGESPDATKYDMEINPRFDFVVGKDSFAPADGQLSVPVSKAAKESVKLRTGESQLTPEQVAALPDTQLCGNRPDPQAPGNQIPVPQG